MKIRFLFLLLITIFSGPPTFAQTLSLTDWPEALTTQTNSEVFRQASSSSDVIGNYKKGTKIKIYHNRKNGFYLVHFEEELNRTRFGWIHMDDVEIIVPEARTSDLSRDFSIWKNRFRFSSPIFQFSPSDVQTNMGATPGSFNSLGYFFDYEHRLTSNSPLALYLALGRYSFTQGMVSPDGLSGSLSLTGYEALAGLSVYFYQRRKFSLAATIAGGYALNSQASVSPTAQLSTSPLTSFPIVGQVTAAYGLSQSFEIIFRLGYQMQTLSNVPVVSLAATSETTTLSTIRLSSPFAAIGAGWSF